MRTALLTFIVIIGSELQTTYHWVDPVGDHWSITVLAMLGIVIALMQDLVEIYKGFK